MKQSDQKETDCEKLKRSGPNKVGSPMGVEESGRLWSAGSSGAKMNDSRRVIVRDVLPADMAGLTAICYAGRPAIHRDRMRDGATGHVRYLVAERSGVAEPSARIVGFGLLVFACSPAWPDAIPEELLPAVVDLHVAADLRGQGIGMQMVRYMEAATLDAGYERLFLSVNPVDNPRAHEWYLRLGYEPLQAQPYLDRWYLKDSDGVVHRGEEWAVDMVKSLGKGRS